MRKRLGQLVGLPLLAAVTLTTASVGNAAAPIKGSLSRCVQGMTLPDAIKTSQAAAVPHVLSSGAEVLQGTSASPTVTIATQEGHTVDDIHSCRMRLRPNGVKLSETDKIIDFQTLCHSWKEKNGDYLEECSFDKDKSPRRGVSAYTTRTILRDGKVDGCRPGMSISFEYGIIPEPTYVQAMAGLFGGFLSDEQINAQLKPVLDSVFENWINGFKAR